MKNFLQNIFSLTNEYKDDKKYKVINILGIRFKIKCKSYKHTLLNNYNQTYLDCLEMYQGYLQNNIKNLDFDIESEKYKLANEFSGCITEKNREYLKMASGYIWGLQPIKSNIDKIFEGLKEGKLPIFIEDTFLRSTINILGLRNSIYSCSCGYTLDDLTCYYDATKPSRLELTINSDIELSEEQIARAKFCIDKIVKNNITKYNHQPIYEPQIGRNDAKKILVVDQSYGDMSISMGLASNETFKNMLDIAIKENPEADIIVKTHPDTMTGKRAGYYSNIKPHQNIYLQTEPINPISLIKYVDKVYVCTSQFGFEALMCGKEVHTFGMPFYAGWGLTIDAQKCDRRIRKRTLEELFYFAYIMFSFYINPTNNKPFEIEDAIEYLIKTRNKYFEENKIN